MTVQTTKETHGRILVVDDYEDARELFAEFLELSGYLVSVARNGVEALESALRDKPDLILMDLSLPVMDGWEACRQLRRDPRTWAVPIIALSGHAREKHPGHQPDAPCDAFLQKPVAPQEVELKIRELLGVPQRRVVAVH